MRLQLFAYNLELNVKHNSEHAHKKRYVITHPHDAKLGVDTSHNPNHKSFSDTHSVTFVDLTPTQVATMHATLPEGCSLEEVQTRSLGLPEETSSVAAASDVNATSAAAKHKSSPYLSSVVACPPPTPLTENMVMFFPDTYIDASLFPGVNLHVGTNHSTSSGPENNHSYYTFACFQKVLGDPNFKCTNIPVFGKDGTATDEAVMGAFVDILNFAKANPKTKVVVYFAGGGGGPSAAYTKVMQEIIKAGIVVAVAAGNSGINICAANIPPTNVPGVVQVGGTQSPGNIMAKFSNWSDVGNNFSKDCVTVNIPAEVIIPQFNVFDQGTSFAVPQIGAWLALYWNANPHATATQVVGALKAATVTIKEQGHPQLPPFTKDREIVVMETAKWCDCNKPRPAA